MLTIKLAYRNILRQRRRSLLTGLSMTGGYILFVFSYSLLEGSYGNVIDFFTRDETGHIQIHKDDYLLSPKIYKTIKDRATIEQALEAHERVESYSPRLFAPALAYAGEKSAPTQVVGIDPMKEPTVSRVAQKLADGKFFDSTPDEDGIFGAMIGKGIANTLQLSVGGEIILISQGADGSVANDIYKVTAIIGNKSSSDKLTVYIPLVAAQMFLSTGDRVHEYALLVTDKYENQRIATELQQSLPGFSVAPWQVVEESFYNTMQSDKQGNYVTMGLIVIIVFIGVLNTVLMSVMERTREFGVLKAIGSRPFNLIRMILLETTCLAAISIFIGILVSMPMIWWLTNYGFALPEPVDMGGVLMQDIRGDFTLPIFLIPAAFMLTTAAFISIFPGLRAARILPRDALGSH